ncbi:hypothetical protein [Haloferax sp. Atlit-48N]|uniref:Uncharacterized protein n=1 Tax=Haloferax sp. Atlit-48N TaxID=2077198 RepID=A0ACD5HVX9_9EURY|nr:hypothetical protein [Haloferax sp. Atlit-48N]
MTDHTRSYRQRCEDCGRVVSIAPYCSSCGASLRDDESPQQATDEASSVLFDRWLCKAAENIDKWGVQNEATLLLAIQEELGELTQAHLEAKHEDGRDSRVDEELDDLGALLLQLHESRQTLLTDGGRYQPRLQRLHELDHVMGVIRSVRASEDEFRAEVASNFDVETDDFDVESELVDGHIVHRARWSP